MCLLLVELLQACSKFWEGDGDALKAAFAGFLHGDTMPNRVENGLIVSESTWSQKILANTLPLTFPGKS